MKKIQLVHSPRPRQAANSSYSKCLVDHREAQAVPPSSWVPHSTSLKKKSRRRIKRTKKKTMRPMVTSSRKSILNLLFIPITILMTVTMLKLMSKLMSRLKSM